MAVFLARQVQDGEMSMPGVSSHIPIAACLLAQKMHAPNLTFLMPSGAVNPKPRALYPSSTDYRYFEGAEAVLDFYEVFENSERFTMDFFCYGGVQVDKYGNINLTAVGGDLKKPKFRGPGLANISFAVTSARTYLYVRSHTKRVLVERVDYLSAPGHIDGPDGRARAGIVTTGPVLCITPLAVFDFPEETRSMRLVSLHEGVTREQVVENTGFQFDVLDELATTEPPTEEELTILRGEIDTTGLLR